MSDEDVPAIDRVRYVLLQRNINGLHQAAEQDRKQIHALADVQLGLQQTVTMQAQTIQRLEQMLTVLMAMRGRGPT